MGTDRSSDQAGFWGRHENVYIYIPNLIGRPPTHSSVASQMYTLTNSNIAVRCETENSAHVLAIKLFLTFRRAATGYGRVLIMLISFTIARTAPLTCVGLYFLGFALDETDGRAARAFNQTSTFGTVLDMVTDRVATSGLLMVLCIVYPDALLVFQLLLILDIFSHWLQMYAASLTGVTHKDAESKSWLVRVYYKHRLFMGFCCVCVEVLYLSAYLLHWQHAHNKPWGSVPLPFVQSLPGGQELLAQAIPQYWKQEGVPILFFVAMAATPGFLIKQATNVFQIKAAARKMVAFDNGKKER